MERLRRFWRDFAGQFAGAWFLGVLFLVATNALTVAIPGFVQRAIDALARGEGTAPAIRWSLAILVAGVGVLVVRVLSRIFFFNPGRTLEKQVKDAMFDRLLALPRRYYDTVRVGEIVSRGTNDTNWMRALVGFGSLQLFNVALMLVLTLGQMLWSDWRLTLWCLAPLAIATLVLRTVVGRMFTLSHLLQAEVAALSNNILESYNGVGVLQAFSAEPAAVARFDEINERLQGYGVRLARVRAWSLPIVSVVGNLCVVIILYVGGHRVAAGSLTLGELAAFIVYLGIVVGALTNFGWLVNAVQRGWISLGRIYEVLQAPLDRPEVRQPVPPVRAGGRALEVSDLTFELSGSRGPILQDVAFSVAPGETVGIFGQTGSGKSVLLQLLARVYEPPPGTVRVDGADVRDLPIRDYRAEVAYVPQDAYLFSATLRENVALAAPPGQIDEARLQAAVRDAALAPDIGDFPKQLDTEVGERGVTLSGGQRQRAALARAFYRDFGVLLLDDVLSAVDQATEKQLIEAIYRRGRDVTTLLVSHRCSALARAQRILVLEGGRLVATGTHAQLIAQEGPYARAWKLQQAAEAIETLEGAGEGAA